MPDYTSATIVDEYRFPLVESEIRRFAEAAWDDNPAYRYRSQSIDIAVPPTFGCLAATLAGRAHSLESLGFDVARAFHGEETILLYRPLEVGSVLTVKDATLRLPDVNGRRGGAMRRARRRSLLLDEHGELVGVTTRTLLEAVEPLTGSVPTGDVAVFDDGLRLRGDPSRAIPVPASALSTTTSLPGAEFGPIARADLVRYAVASADLTAIHYDEFAARRHGYQTTFGMGMLSAAYIGHMISDWVTLEYPWRLSVRFRDQIWPGDTLTVTGRVTASDDEHIVIDVACASDRGPAATAALELWKAASAAPGPDDY